ncbi:MAG: glycosyltransferase family 4 protein [Methylohalobius crimeensis]
MIKYQPILWMMVIVTGFGVAWWATRRLLLWRGRECLLDRPNLRSSHTVPTPRGGGVGIVGAFGLVSLGLWAVGGVPGWAAMAVVGAGLGVAAIGFWDDLGHVPIGWRLVVHAGAAVWGLVWVTAGRGWTLAEGGWATTGDCPYAMWVAAGLMLVWLINLYNFMDGIDGLAAVEAITVASGAAGILFLEQRGDLGLWLLGLAAATGGFLVWNFPPAKIFLGDVGSGFLGCVLGMLALVTVAGGAMTVGSWGILLAVFITDASVTLLRRMVAGERWWQAHRSHAYQHLARRFGHLPVTLAVGALNLFWLLPWAWVASVYPDRAIGGTVIAYLPLLGIAWRAGAGVSEGRFRRKKSIQ